MAHALAANDGVAQQLELEKIRVSAQVEIGVSQARALGQAWVAMDFKLYGTPEAAQQLLRLVSFSDGLGNLVQNAPPALKELGGRLAERLLPANGSSGHSNGGDSAAPLNLAAAQPLIAEGSAILKAHLSPDELGALTVREAIERALALAPALQHPTLLKLQGLLTLLPVVSEQKAALVIEL